MSPHNALGDVSMVLRDTAPGLTLCTQWLLREKSGDMLLVCSSFGNTRLKVEPERDFEPPISVTCDAGSNKTKRRELNGAHGSSLTADGLSGWPSSRSRAAAPGAGVVAVLMLRSGANYREGRAEQRTPCLMSSAASSRSRRQGSKGADEFGNA
ncbi:hypothetical protein HaLaN_02209 [Haematococcus lacustris]|uniref:Uncharacterized protein n=1 Tax=Haematococcus lacustris TaxID=44745 RepID=A0A699YKN1_HAELA|nr:hypothetical protein HaLaN_02209 [Haematococcus lacustris]